jgi:glycyl-tRNA synthetase beta chain
VVDETIFEKPQEKELYLQTIKLEETIYPLLQKKQYLQIMEELVRFSGVIDLFFDKVLVNTDDVKLKENRYALLSKIRKIFLNFADLNKLD